MFHDSFVLKYIELQYHILSGPKIYSIKYDRRLVAVVQYFVDFFEGFEGNEK